MNQRISKSIQPVLEDYANLTSRQLPGLIHGFYIVGSIALGEFNERFSDIDFVGVIDHKPSTEEFARLRNIHRMVEKNYPRWKLEGGYVQQNYLGHFGGDVELHPHYHDGTLHREHSSSDPITLWILKNYGIPVIGSRPGDLPFTVNWDMLISWMKENLNSYWTGWTKRFDRRLVLLSDWGIQWCVLGVLRQHFTFQENAITTKVKAGEYALTCLPTRWHRIIQEAIDIREGKRKSAYPFKVLRMMEAVNFLKYIIQFYNGSLA